MISTSDFLERLQIDHQTLKVWIEEEWLLPVGGAEAPLFSDADLARARLIRDLMDDMGVNAAGVGVTLNLVDQIHGLRNVLAQVVRLARDQSPQRGG
jgi:chaperone modulatory protein CbpM